MKVHEKREGYSGIYRLKCFVHMYSVCIMVHLSLVGELIAAAPIYVYDTVLFLR